ncbi:MAG: M36 family metallopeptidase [Saprospiraceae bacterium]|nr:M36 family metallopeptidase [Saprospiraceae bacterium]
MKKLLYTIIASLMVLISPDLKAQSQSYLDQGMRFIEQKAENWGLQESDYINSMVSDMYTSNKTGITYIYLVQAHNGIPIHNAITPVVIDTKGKVRVVNHSFIAGAKDKVTSTKASITPQAAIKSAVSHLGILATDMPALLRSDSKTNTYEFGKPSFAHNEMTVKLVYIQDGDALKLAWNLAIDEIDRDDYYNTFVDANTGEVISKFNFTVKCTFHKGQYDKHVGCSKDHAKKSSLKTFAEASALAEAVSVSGGTYTVYALPTESPAFGDRTVEVDPFFPDASPFGWHDTNQMDGAEYTITRGNNVHAYLDKSDLDTSSGDEPDGGDDLVFDQSFSTDNSAVENEDGAVVNLFYMNNMMHDISYRMGFDEQAGNFQANNYGNGGSGDDYILAQASDGFNLYDPTNTTDPQPINNASFSIVPDGANGRMSMFLWNNPSGILSIDEPEALEGFLIDVGTATGQFGFGGPIPDENGTAVTGKVVVATDGSPANPTTCCNPITNGDEIAGNIALIDRGLCDFSLKAWHAQEAGAISVIICNIVGGGDTDGLSSFGMAGGENADLVTITPLSLGKTDCDRIRASLASDIDVVLTIQSRPPMGSDFLDGSVDNGVIAHEYAHGISSRLVGGPGSPGCLNNDEQPGEGISDYFSLVTTVEEGDKGEDLRGIAIYAGPALAVGGIRNFPYTTDMNINPRVYDDIKTATNTDGSTAIYTIGEVWTSALWEVYWGFVDAFGLDTKWEDEESGNFKAVRLTIEGMKMTQCSPSLIDLRDGIMQADSMFYDGAHAEILWTAFAKRGLGYLADDGGDATDKSNGTQNFDPFPLAIESLKVQQEVQSIVTPGESVNVTVTAQNHIPETQTGVLITVNIPEGLDYVDGSASMPATFENEELIFEIGDMEFKDELTITYEAIARSNVKSETLFFDDVEDVDFDLYDFGAIEGFNLWFQSSDFANSGDLSWWASQPDPEVEEDFYMDIPPLQVVGDKPALKFIHRYDSEIAVDGGFITISTDGGIVFRDIKEKFIRNGYPISINYSTFAIPELEGFSGSSNDEWVDSYIDLSEYIGQEIVVRFRFGTNETGGTNAAFPGWYVDDLEMLDLKTYESFACISSENSSETQCTPPVNIIVESDGILGTEEELDGFDISVAPNPASDYVSIGLSAEQTTPIQLMLTSIDGRIVKNMNLVVGNNQSIRTFDTSTLEKGIYLIQIKSEKGLTTKKVIIQ